jgi:hypothetical protein
LPPHSPRRRQHDLEAGLSAANRLDFVRRLIEATIGFLRPAFGVKLTRLKRKVQSER